MYILCFTVVVSANTKGEIRIPLYNKTAFLIKKKRVDRKKDKEDKACIGKNIIQKKKEQNMLKIN